MAQWTGFPHTGDYGFDAASIKKNWARLHQGDCEPLPKDAAVLAAWVLFHNGEFQKAFDAGIKAGEAGLTGGVTVANKAACIYANYLETKEKSKLDMFMEAAARAEGLQKNDPKNANAYYWQAYALGRYGQGISVAKALAQGLGTKVKQSLEHAIKLQPQHADAHIALAAFHAEVIDKVGSLIGGMTYGAKKDVGLNLFKKALELNPTSAIGMIEYANGLVMLDGDKKMKEATKLYEQAASCKALDATERLDVEMAKAELED